MMRLKFIWVIWWQSNSVSFFSVVLPLRSEVPKKHNNLGPSLEPQNIAWMQPCSQTLTGKQPRNSPNQGCTCDYPPRDQHPHITLWWAEPQTFHCPSQCPKCSTWVILPSCVLFSRTCNSRLLSGEAYGLHHPAVRRGHCEPKGASQTHLAKPQIFGFNSIQYQQFCSSCKPCLGCLNQPQGFGHLSQVLS